MQTLSKYNKTKTVSTIHDGTAELTWLLHFTFSNSKSQLPKVYLHVLTYSNMLTQLELTVDLT